MGTGITMSSASMLHRENDSAATLQHRSDAVSVSVRNWAWRHAGRAHAALSGLDLEIRAGERVLLAGPSGAGKSTLLYALAGVLDEDDETYSSGELLLDGAPAAQGRGLVGLMQQDPETQVVQARVGDDVAFGAENLSVPPAQIRQRIVDALDAVGLDVPQDHPTSALSGGQKQRLALAGILAMGPGLVLLDEPTANLDPDGVLEVRDAVLAALDSTGATLLIVEHRLEAWAAHMDRVIVLEPGGGIAHDGTPAELFAPGPVREKLIAAGVWVPGYTPAFDPLPAPEQPGALLLEATDLAVTRKRGAKPAASGLALRLGAGEAWCVRGANGSGKSTFALTLGGLLPVGSGTVLATGELASGTEARPYHWRATELVGRIGSVFQEPEHQFVTNTVAEELAYGPRHAVKPGTREPLFTEQEISLRVSSLLSRLRLGHLAEANPFTLSGGEKRRLSVATVLAAGPQVLILDEPTFGQDANTWRELALLLREELARGTAIIAVTHDADFARALGAHEFVLASPATAEGTAPVAARPGLLEADVRGGTSFLGRANPLAKLAAVALATIPLVASMDWVSSGIVVAATILALPLAGLSIPRFLARGWPLLLAAIFGAWGTALVGNDSGAVLLDLGLFTITEGSLAAGAATGMRAFAVAIPAVLVLFTTDPTDLANALAQKARLPHRFVLGALAGMRLLGLLIEEWTTLGMARRARGVGSRGSAAARLRANLGQVFGLLVQAIRRASRLAVTMEAKGFGTAERTWLRPSRYGLRDAGIVAAGLLLGTAATWASLALGTWNLVWS
ncbi:energy-coupling factor transport system ATP-binding protein [Paeniglutamicibacter psychrophenolicus]|uniref:Energy-coupling factor transport system ATP-binding protein n=2 Tax=Paeniglutamicibacter psychrophenolicus TaxID=257454 RepID=A0ABS4WBX4_9MICC|nr:energy-coupling factor transport system ATP-binding protein [Paeniglutamicibacter psychrophenolicus]